MYNDYNSQIDDINDVDKISKLNSGGLINLRLDALWKDVHKHSREGLYSSWNADLDRIWSELGGEYPEDSEEQKKLDIINKELNSVNNWTGSHGFKKVTHEDKLEMARQYIILMKKELYLRRVQNKQGKGTAYSDGSEDDWE